MAHDTLADQIRKLLGADTSTQINRVVSQIGVAAIPILRQQPNRLAFVIINLGTDQIFVGPFNNPSSTRGIQLGASGGNLTAVYFEDFELVGREWFGIANLAATDVLIMELITEPVRPGSPGSEAVV